MDYLRPREGIASPKDQPDHGGLLQICMAEALVTLTKSTAGPLDSHKSAIGLINPVVKSSPQALVLAYRRPNEFLEV